MNKNVHDLLNKKKGEIKDIKAPQEIEDMVYKTISQQSRETKSKQASIMYAINLKLVTTVCIVFFMLFFISYSNSALAYYGKKMIGYENVVSPSLASLLRDGVGQRINNEVKLENGDVFIFDGVIYDDEELTILARIDNNDVSQEYDHHNINFTLKGLFGKTYYMNSGLSERDPASGNIKMVREFELPNFYETYLWLHYDFKKGDHKESGKIRFRLNREEAEIKAYEQELNQEVNVNDYTVKFEKVYVSAYELKIKSRTKDLFTKEHKKFEYVKYDLLINNKNLIEHTGPFAGVIEENGESTSYFNITRDIKSLEVVNIRIGAIYDCECDPVIINNNIKDYKVMNGFIIKNVMDVGDETVIKIRSMGDPYLAILEKEGKSLEIDKKLVDQIDSYNIYEIRFNKTSNPVSLGLKTITVEEAKTEEKIALIDNN